MDIEKQEFICVVHKGPITGNIYVCPRCQTIYCQKCVSALKENNEKCWSCDQDFNV